MRGRRVRGREGDARRKRADEVVLCTLVTGHQSREKEKRGFIQDNESPASSAISSLPLPVPRWPLTCRTPRTWRSNQRGERFSRFLVHRDRLAMHSWMTACSMRSVQSCRVQAKERWVHAFREHRRQHDQAIVIGW